LGPAASILGRVTELLDISRLLDQSALLGALPTAAKARLAAAARPVRFAAGAVIFRRGEPGEGMLLLLHGLVRVHLASAGGREMTISLVGAGEPMGEIALIDGGPRSADATALSPVSALSLRHSDLKALLLDTPELALALLTTLAARLRRTTEQAEAVGLRTLQQRLASALLHLAALDPTGLVRQPQGQIAALIAATRPRVNTALTEFRARGLIEPARVGLRLTDRAGLLALVEAG